MLLLFTLITSFLCSYGIYDFTMYEDHIKDSNKSLISDTYEGRCCNNITIVRIVFGIILFFTTILLIYTGYLLYKYTRERNIEER